MDERLEAVENRASNNLRELGFGVHESLVIVALNKMQSATVSEISSATGIHHANLYTILDGLEGKGLVVSDNSRPRRYVFAPLSHIEDYLESKVHALMIDLKKIQQSRISDSLIPTLIYTIRGHDDVLNKILSMISKVSERILLVTPALEIMGDPVIEALENASRGEVEIRLILGQDVDVPFKSEKRLKDDTLAINLVVDGKEALISMPDLTVCGWADNHLISLQFEGYLEQTWELARMI